MPWTIPAWHLLALAAARPWPSPSAAGAGSRDSLGWREGSCGTAGMEALLEPCMPGFVPSQGFQNNPCSDMQLMTPTLVLVGDELVCPSHTTGSGSV